MNPADVIANRWAVRVVVGCLTAALALACASCGGPKDNHERIYPVSGKLTCNGSPASGAVVVFRRGKDVQSNRGPEIMGVVAGDGSFEIVSGALGKGAPVGDYDVLVEWTRLTGPGRRRPQTGPDLLQGRFADPRHPLLHAKVEPAENDLPPFELTISTGQAR